MKGTILYAEYDEGTGISTVTKYTKYGTFTRSVRVHSQDQDIANQYDGCYFAELKCDIAAYKQRANFIRERAKGMQHVLNVIRQALIQKHEITGNWNIDSNSSFIINLLEDQINTAWDLADQAYDTYKILKESYKAFIETTLRQRREMRSRIGKRYDRVIKNIQDSDIKVINKPDYLKIIKE